MLVGQQQRLQEDIREIVAQHGRTRSALIPVLQELHVFTGRSAKQPRARRSLAIASPTRWTRRMSEKHCEKPLWIFQKARTW